MLHSLHLGLLDQAPIVAISYGSSMPSKSWCSALSLEHAVMTEISNVANSMNSGTCTQFCSTSKGQLDARLELQALEYWYQHQIIHLLWKPTQNFEMAYVASPTANTPTTMASRISRYSSTYATKQICSWGWLSLEQGQWCWARARLWKESMSSAIAHHKLW